MTLLEPFAGLVGSGTDVATMVLLAYALLRERRPYRMLKAGVLALATESDEVDADQLRSELKIDEDDVQALREGGRSS